MNKIIPSSVDQAIVELEDSILYNSFCDQLMKDFRLCGLSTDDIKTENLDALQQSLLIVIHHLLEKDVESLRALLYRIDLNEEKLVDLMTEGDEGQAERISQALLIRVLQKVWYRLNLTSSDLK